MQVFHMNVAKIDRDVVYVAMVVHVCYKLLFPTFHLFFRHILQVCLSRCCICFTYMLQVFYRCCVCVYNGFQVFLDTFASVSDICFKCFICLQTYIANVIFECFKVHRVLHMLRRDSLGVAPCCCCGAAWVTVQAPEGVRRLRGVHLQAG